MRTRTKLYIQSTTNKEINLVLRFFGQSGASAVRADMKISAILLKYATFEGVFFHIFVGKTCTTLSQETYISIRIVFRVLLGMYNFEQEVCIRLQIKQNKKMKLS